MDSVMNIFREAYARENGYMLAQSLTPVAPANDLAMLYKFHTSVNAYSVQQELRNAIVYQNEVKLIQPEAKAWIEVYMAYWKAIGELLASAQAIHEGKNADWKRVYESWKEVLNALLRGYTNNAFAAWTIPCLYVAGKYSRNFAIKADEQARRTEGNVAFNEGFQDDVVGALGKNDCLQDAARQINRIFSTCITDRYASAIQLHFDTFPC